MVNDSCIVYSRSLSNPNFSRILSRINSPQAPCALRSPLRARNMFSASRVICMLSYYEGLRVFHSTQNYVALLSLWVLQPALSSTIFSPAVVWEIKYVRLILFSKLVTFLLRRYRWPGSELVCENLSFIVSISFFLVLQSSLRGCDSLLR